LIKIVLKACAPRLWAPALSPEVVALPLRDRCIQHCQGIIALAGIRLDLCPNIPIKE
jgi:hypothetical protein